MTEADISQVLGQHLQTLAGLPTIYWDNQDIPETQNPPYIQVQMVRTGRRNIANDGTAAKVSAGFVQITVVEAENTFATQSQTTADDICAHFPKALGLDGSTGRVTITEEPDVVPGFRDGPEWRVPVRVEYVGI